MDHTKKKRKPIDIFLVTATILLPVCMAMQGFDLNDTGYHAYHAAHFLDYTSVTDTSQIFSKLFDYLFYQVFGWMGLRSLYLLNICILLLSAFLAYKMVITLAPKTVALLGSLVSVLFAMNFIRISNYNSKSVLLAVLCAYFLFIGLTKNKKLFFLLGGVIAGLSIFFRFPNVMFVLFIAAILYWNIVKRQKASLFFQQTLLFLLGMALSVCVSVAVVLCMDHISPVSISFFSIESSSTGSYRIIALLRGYVLGILQALGNAFPYLLIFACGVCTFFAAKIDSALTRRLVYCINTCVCLFAGLYLALHFDAQAVVVLCGVVTYIGAVYFLRKKTFTPSFGLLFIFGILIAAIPCIGSNTKIDHAKLGLFVLVPLSFYLVYFVWTRLKANTPKLPQFLFKGGAVLLLGTFALHFAVYNTAYMEPANRLQATSAIQSEKMRGIFTSSFRAEFSNTAIAQLSAVSNPYMIVYGADGIHYLTDKIPYLNRAGINFDTYTKDRLQKDLYAQNDKPLPIVLLPKVDTYSYQRHVIKNKSEKQRIIEAFVQNNRYKTQYEDDNMVIYVPA